MKRMHLQRFVPAHGLVLFLAVLFPALKPNTASAQTTLLNVTSTGAVTISTNNAIPSSSGGIYVFQKSAHGILTFTGQITGGAGSILRTTTDTSGDSTTMFDFTVASPSYTGSIQLYRGIVRADNALALGTGTIECDGNVSKFGDLTFGASMTFTNALLLQEYTTLSASNYNVTLSGVISDGSNSYGFTNFNTGTGTLTLSGANTYHGTTVLGGVSTAGGTLALGANNTLPAGNPLIIDNRSGASTLSLGSFNQNVGAVTFYAGGAQRTNITGTGNLVLSGNVTLVDPHAVSGGQDYPLAINAPIDLNGANRVFSIGFGNNAESSDLGDLHINSVIKNSTGTAGITFTNWSTGGTNFNGSVTLSAANTYNGPTTLAGYTGSEGGYTDISTLALNANNAIPNASAFIQTTGTILDLTAWGATTGITTGMGSLTGAGSLVLGSAGILTIGYDNTSPAAYSGVISGSNSCALVKTGSGTLTLAGANTYTGNTIVSNGTLLVNGTVTGGLVKVGNGATLGGSGSITASVTVSNGASLTPGNASGLGTLTVNSLTLGATGSDAITLNCTGSGSGVVGLAAVVNANALTNNGTVTINVNGFLPFTTPATYNLLTYSGAIKGSGNFVLGTTPLSPAYITNNTSAAAIQLIVPFNGQTVPVTWVGSPTNSWDLLGSNVWNLTADGTPTAFANGDAATFDDTASNFTVKINGSVAPGSVGVTNTSNNYVFSGTGGIVGASGLAKSGTTSLTLSTSNNYSGLTDIEQGTLALGNAFAIPSGAGAGSTIVNGTLDLGGFSPALNNLSGAGAVDNITAGGSPVLNLTNSSASTFAGTIQNSSGSLGLNLGGSGKLILSGANTYTGGTVINTGTLQIGAGGTSGAAGPGTVIDNGTLAFNRTDTVTNLNDISGNGGLQQNGSGTVYLDGNLSYLGTTVVNAGVLGFLENNVTFDVSTGSTLAIAANAVVQSDAEQLSLNVNASSTAIDVSGAGTLQLISVINSVETFPDIFFGPNHSGSLDYGTRLACPLNLGSLRRNIYGLSGRNDVTRYGLTGCDCQFAGTISGTAGMTIVGQNSWAPGVNTMEVPFALLASNSFTGPLEIKRGSVYLGNAAALTNGNVLNFDPASSVNSRLFLYGFNAVVSDLQSSGLGNAFIADGNNVTTTNVGPATLTVTQNNPYTFSGTICDWYAEYIAATTGSMTPKVSLVKNGAAALTLAGTNTYSGTTVINAGKIYFNSASTGGGAVTVNNGGTLGGNNVISSAVTVNSGGAVEGGDGTGNGALKLKSLTLGSSSSDTEVLNVTVAAPLNVTNSNGLTISSGSGKVTINVGGTIGATGRYALVTYSGTLGGTGYSAFQLGSLPSGVVGVLSNDTTLASVDLVVTSVVVPRWSGALSTEWSTNTLAAPKNWVLDSDGVTSVDYLNGETVKFTDTATSTTVNLSVASVSPQSVIVSNAAKSFTITGAFTITGSATFTKQGSGKVTLGTTNTYTGGTTVTAGTLALGAAGAVPGGTGAGNVTVNGTLDVAGFSPTFNHLTGSGMVDNASAGGSPVLTVNNITNSTFSGVIKNTTGALGLVLNGGGTLTLSGTNTASGWNVVSNGTLVLNGALGSGGLTVASGATLGGTGTINGSLTLVGGSSLALTAGSPMTAGAFNVSGAVSVTASGSISTSNSATYVLINHGARGGSGTFTLVPIAGLQTYNLSASLVDTNGQLKLVIAPAALTGTIADVRHVVIFMQENRSFDHYYGTLQGVHGFGDRNALVFTNGNTDFYQPSGSTYYLPYHNTFTCITDFAHDWVSTHQAIDSDRNDAWIAAKGSGSMEYDTRSDIPYYYALADNFTICDNYHCAARTSTCPNRSFLWTGWNDPNGTAGGPETDNSEPGFSWGTYPELLQTAGISWKVYQQSDNYDDNALAWYDNFRNAKAGNPLYDRGMATVTDLATAIRADVSNNVLPAVSWIVAPTASSEHPPYSPNSGEALTKSLLDAIASNPAVYTNTVFLLVYDENDGFFDHDIPISPTNGTPNEFPNTYPTQPNGLGVRVPLTVVSPWSTGGYVCSQVFDHTSVLRFLETWTGIREPNISAWRRQVCGDLTSCFDFAHPNPNYPSLTAVSAVTCSSGSTTPVPGTQAMPALDSGAVRIPRPLPYQPNAAVSSTCGSGTLSLTLTNSGAASVHFLVFANAYRTDGPWPYDVASSNAATASFNVTASSGNYDFTVYGPNSFQRRFAGNVNTHCGVIEASSAYNPGSGSVALLLANPSAATKSFTVTNGYATGTTTYNVPASTTNVVTFAMATNNCWYDFTVTASGGFTRRFLGRVETNNAPVQQIASSLNASGFKDNVTFTTVFAGYDNISGTVQFRTNGVAMGTPVPLNGGTATISTAALSRGNIPIAAEYSGDLLNPPSTNNLTQTVTNHPPVLVGSPTVARTPDASLKIKISDLLTNAVDADGDVLTMSSADTTSSLGVAVSTDTLWVYYHGGTNMANDTFNYTISDNFGGVVTNPVTVTTSPFAQFRQAASVSVDGGNAARLDLAGIPGFKYSIQRSTDLTNWTTILTTNAPATGGFTVQDTFSDLGAPPPTAFYRMMWNGN